MSKVVLSSLLVAALTFCCAAKPFCSSDVLLEQLDKGKKKKNKKCCKGKSSCSKETPASEIPAEETKEK